jgi:flagellar biosynthetic protein FlhB
MAEDNGDKTEAPTPKRRREAREQGTIAKSPDLTAAVVILGLMYMLNWYGPNIVTSLKGLMGYMLSGKVLADSTTGGISTMVFSALRTVGIAMAPLMVGVVILAVLVNICQVGFFFSMERLTPNFAALNPVGGLSKMFGGGSGTGMQLLMNTIKMLMVGSVAYSAVSGRMGQIIAVQKLTFLQIFGLGASIVFTIIVRITILLLVLAIGDYIYQRFRIEKQLKMTKQEVKEEMRSMEGDPKIKARRRQIAIQMVTKQFKKSVPTADVVVTNPTEFAIAIKYDADNMTAPRVVAKGQGYLALKIREIAIEHGIPILERKPLARALYKLVDIGQEIPEQFYSAVAEILAYVYELTGKLKKNQQLVNATAAAQ